MIDLDLVDVGSKLTITTDGGDAIKKKVEFAATHNVTHWMPIQELPKGGEYGTTNNPE